MLLTSDGSLCKRVPQAAVERSVLATDIRKLPVDRLQLTAHREVRQECDGPEDSGEDEDMGER